MSYQSEVLADSPAGYWRMNDASGLIQDSSGNARHATSSYGSLTYQQSSPITSDATARSILIATGGFVVPQSAGINFGDTLTIEGWIKRAAAAQNDWLVDRGGNGADGGYRVFIRNDNPDKLVLSQATVDDTFVSNDSFDATAQWWHICAGKSGATVRVVVNGTQITGTESITTYDDFADDLHIGDVFAENGTTNAYLAEVAVYSTLLSVTRMRAHYTAATASAADDPPHRILGFGAGW